MFDLIYKITVMVLLTVIAVFLIYLCWMFEREFLKSEEKKDQAKPAEIEKIERVPKRTF